jgi:hypothetical protein
MMRTAENRWRVSTIDHWPVQSARLPVAPGFAPASWRRMSRHMEGATAGDPA